MHSTKPFASIHCCSIHFDFDVITIKGEDSVILMYVESVKSIHKLLLGKILVIEIV